MKIIQVLFVFTAALLATGIANANLIQDPAEFTKNRLSEYSGSDDGISCENPVPTKKGILIYCENEPYAWEDWGANGPVSTYRKDFCNYEFSKSANGFTVVNGECHTDSAGNY